MGQASVLMKSETGYVPKPAKQRVDVVLFLDWVYRRQKARIESGYGLIGAENSESERHAVSRDGCAAIERIKLFGDRIMGSGARVGALHPDAETAHEIVVAMGEIAASLIIRHAEAGGVPDAMIGAASRFMPVRRYLGERGGVLVQSMPGSGWKFCPVELVCDDYEIAMARAIYRAWHDHVTALARQLALADLRSHDVIPTTLSAEPWLSR
jgi:hypothetical protein